MCQVRSVNLVGSSHFSFNFSFSFKDIWTHQVTNTSHLFNRRKRITTINSSCFPLSSIIYKWQNKLFVSLNTEQTKGYSVVPLNLTKLQRKEEKKKRLKCRPSTIFYVPCPVSGVMLFSARKSSFHFVWMLYHLQFAVNFKWIIWRFVWSVWSMRGWPEVMKEGMMIFISFYVHKRHSSFTWTLSWVEVRFVSIEFNLTWTRFCFLFENGICNLIILVRVHCTYRILNS